MLEGNYFLRNGCVWRLPTIRLTHFSFGPLAMSVQLCHFHVATPPPSINDHVIIWVLMAVVAQLHLPNWYVCSLSFCLSKSHPICPPALLCLNFSSVFLSRSVSFLAAPGAMANHLIPNALLRPHGTNNPYNTLLGDSAVYNNPLGMYNTQGVLASFHSLTLWLGQCFFFFFFFPVCSWRNSAVSHPCSCPGTDCNFMIGEL